MKVRMRRGVGFEGRSLAPGEVHDLPDRWARLFIQQGRAEPVEDAPEPVAVREGYHTTDLTAVVRDPVPGPGRRKR